MLLFWDKTVQTPGARTPHLTPGLVQMSWKGTQAIPSAQLGEALSLGMGPGNCWQCGPSRDGGAPGPHPPWDGRPGACWAPLGRSLVAHGLGTPVLSGQEGNGFAVGSGLCGQPPAESWPCENPGIMGLSVTLQGASEDDPPPLLSPKERPNPSRDHGLRRVFSLETRGFPSPFAFPEARPGSDETGLCGD